MDTAFCSNKKLTFIYILHQIYFSTFLFYIILSPFYIILSLFYIINPFFNHFYPNIIFNFQTIVPQCKELLGQKGKIESNFQREIQD